MIKDNTYEQFPNHHETKKKNRRQRGEKYSQDTGTNV